MTKRFAGTALAAVVSACALTGGAQTAKAAAFSFDAYVNDTAADGGGSFSFSVDTKTKKGSLSYGETEQGPVLTAVWYYWNYSGPAIVTGFSSSIKQSSDGYTVKNFSIGLSSSGGSGTFIDDEYPNGSYTYPIDNFSADISYTAYYFEDYLVNEYVEGLPFNSYYNYNAVQVGISGDPFPSTVPLPNAAPLFGAALLALGGIGYARRRKVNAA